MITGLATKHEDYDFDMELLATLPTEDCAVPLAGLVRDFGHDNQRPVREAIARLRKDYRIDVHVQHPDVAKRGSLISIRSHSWQAAKAMAEAYWGKVYG